MQETIKVLGEKKFRSMVVKETAYGIVDDYGVVDNKMTLQRVGNALFIAWEVGKDGEIDYAEIGITTVGKDVTDYDGVFDLPREAIQLLSELGFNTKEVEVV